MIMLKVSSFQSCFTHWTVSECTPLENVVLEYFFAVLPREEFGRIERISYGPVVVDHHGMVNQVVRIEGRQRESYCFYVFAQRTREIKQWSVVGKSRKFFSTQLIPDDLDVRWETWTPAYPFID
jgi:hypothetical protein